MAPRAGSKSDAYLALLIKALQVTRGVAYWLALLVILKTLINVHPRSYFSPLFQSILILRTDHGTDCGVGNKLCAVVVDSIKILSGGCQKLKSTGPAVRLDTHQTRNHAQNAPEIAALAMSTMPDPHFAPRVGEWEEEGEPTGCDLREDSERVPLLPGRSLSKVYDHDRSQDAAQLDLEGPKPRFHLRAKRLIPRPWIFKDLSSRFRSRFSSFVYIVLIVLLSVAIWLAVFQIGFAMDSSYLADGDSDTGSPRFFPPSIQHSWGPYTPYFPVKPYTAPPPGCKINQVNIIQRHGSRFPTTGATARILSALEHLQSATAFPDPKFAFLANYTYTLGMADLMPYGAWESEEAGKLAYTRYSHLFSTTDIPFVRSSGGTRVVDSATNWTSGFSFANNGVYKPVVSVILDEKLNDTLEDAMCPNAGTSDEQTALWTSVYAAPIAARLNQKAPGARVTAADVSNLIPLCAFETLAKESPSPFCDLFSASEFAQYEYNADLDKYYGTGYGQDLGRVQGVGYVNELLARLTRTPVRDHTQTNRTQDGSPATFPLDRALYADFSHDNEMIAIYAALGLFGQPRDLDPGRMEEGRTWVTSWMTPFGGRMVAERLGCRVQGRGRREARAKEGTFVRILVNDAVQPLEFCGGDEHGLCALDKFVESQSYARNDGEGDFERCGYVAKE